jgi:4a-hydroxytetrahydrobiopterin dehydratase
VVRPRPAGSQSGYHPLVTARHFEICIDATDPDRLRPFWRAALGYVDLRTDEGVVDLVDPAGVGPTVWFQAVPEPKVAKNRLHLDIEVPSADLRRPRPPAGPAPGPGRDGGRHPSGVHGARRS